MHSSSFLSQASGARISLLGIPIDAVTMEEVLQRLHGFLNDGTAHHVMTPNSEMLAQAAKNEAFRAILRSSALNLPDSAGLLWAARWTGQTLAQRVTGVDTVQRFCSELDEHHPIFLLGAAPGIAEKAAAALQARNPRLRIAGTFSGSPKEDEAGALIARINQVQPHLLLVAFGAPRQDLWIAKHLSQLPTLHIAMGVGGTFDILAGKQKRAPVFVQSLALEWLWRLVREPWRWKRIWTAVVVFPFLIMRFGQQGPENR